MNLRIVQSYKEVYKRNFEQISKEEIYKWRAVKQFQDHFDLEADDLHSNMKISLSKVSNLMDSGQYYPKRMLLRNTGKNPERIRELFRHLFDEDLDLLQRIASFRASFKVLNSDYFPDDQDFQDARALLVYLNLRYPERYYLYKFEMFKSFARKIESSYRPSPGKMENVGQFLNTCEILRHELEQDQELLRLHATRLDSKCYRDKNHHILTQDFIYAIASHLEAPASAHPNKVDITQIRKVETEHLATSKTKIDFTPRLINHLKNQRESKRLGDLGEEFVMQYERDWLKKNGKEKLAKKVKHVAKEQGDGAGFDILSYGEGAIEKLIEVKTTQGSMNTPFFITRNELERSIQDSGKYFLYRVYDFDEKKNTAKLLIIQGDLSSLCQEPTSYSASLDLPD